MEHIIDLLVIAAHPDDAEIGLGATLAMMAASGKKTAIIDLTDGEPTPHGSPDIRAQESSTASQILGLTARINLGLKNRELVDSVEARVSLSRKLRDLRPHTVCIPFHEDNHPDHMAAHNLAIAACFYSKFVKSEIGGTPWTPRRIFHYFGFHLRIKESPSLIVSVDNFFDKKMAAVRAYHSQFVAHAGNQQVLKDIEADGRYWGSRVKTQFGEPLLSREHLKVCSAEVLLDI